MDQSSSTIPPAVERFTGFAGTYDRYRPSPPDALSEFLTQIIHTPVPDLVVDLGCGTGLSTRFWASRARQVIGVDPTRDMLTYAASRTGASNVSYLFGYGHQVALASGCADIVTCSQSLHWMDPGLTLPEVVRLLRAGGVFAVYDQAPPVVPDWEMEIALQAIQQKVDALENAMGLSTRMPRWSKYEHLPSMQASGLFRFTREFYLHFIEMGNADLLIGGVLSSGQIQDLFKAGVSERDLGLDKFREQAQRLLGDEMRPWYRNVHVRIGVV